MILNLGLLFIIFAFFIGFAQLINAIYGFKRQSFQIMKQTKKFAWLQSGLTIMSLLCLIYGFLVVDLSSAYIASQANITLPWYYRIGAVWSAREGSFLLWSACMAVWTMFFIVRGKRLPLSIHSSALGVLGLINSLFLLTVFKANPFTKLTTTPWSGLEIQPILQDGFLLIHPIFLYLGYTGFVLVFALTVVTLIQKKINLKWAEWTIQWVRGAWVTLTIGIVLGSFWAYHELGWGGIWFWDPVENASLFPWFCGLALLHALFVMKKNNIMKTYVVVLGISTFMLSLIGTFVVRSGLIISVHSFANNLADNALIAAIIILIGILGYGIFFYYRKDIRSTNKKIAPFSPTGMIRTQSYLVMGMLAVVLWGTLYPLILSTINAGQISVGAPYYNQALAPFLFAILLLISYFHLSYIQSKQPLKLLILCLVPSVFAGIYIGLTQTHDQLWLLAIFAAVITFLLITALCLLIAFIKKKKNINHALSIVFAHVGFAVMAAGFVGNTLFSQLYVKTFDPNKSIELGGYQLEVQSTKKQIEQNHVTEKFVIHVMKNKQMIAELMPGRRTYMDQQSTSESAIKYGFLYDIHLTIGETINEDNLQIGLGIKYMTWWVWIGGLLSALGGLIALKNHRYTPARSRNSKPNNRGKSPNNPSSDNRRSTSKNSSNNTTQTSSSGDSKKSGSDHNSPNKSKRKSTQGQQRRRTTKS